MPRKGAVEFRGEPSRAQPRADGGRVSSPGGDASAPEVEGCRADSLTEGDALSHIARISGIDMLEASGEAALVMDRSGIVLYCNSATEQLQRRSRSEIIGQPIQRFSAGETPIDAASEVWEHLLAGKHWSGYIWAHRGDGSRLPIFVTRSPLCDPDGSVIGVLSLATDRTVEHEAKRALEDSEQRLRLVAADLSKRALTDPLTTLPNRALLTDRLEGALRRLARESSLVAVMFVDVDRFKLVNDALGHDAGDSLLVTVGARMSREVRSTDTVARFGGDEFVVVFEDIESRSQVETFGNRLTRAVASPFQLEGEEITPNVSIGAAMTSDPTVAAASLVRDADIAMYAAKQAGGNCCVMFAPGMRPSLAEPEAEDGPGGERSDGGGSDGGGSDGGAQDPIR